MSPLIYIHLMHVSWIRGSRELKVRPHISVGFLQKSKVRLPAAQEKGKVIGRAEIAEHVWDEKFDAFSNLIDVYIKRLRSKMDEGFSIQLIQTRRGAGYILDDM